MWGVPIVSSIKWLFGQLPNFDFLCFSLVQGITLIRPSHKNHWMIGLSQNISYSLTWVSIGD
jgi:hypothetical protein